jgi:5-methylcytosine-specific restriction endonuclease McrA
MIEALKLLIEPDFIPFDAVQPQEERTDRYVPSEVKIAVWRRDGGKGVECGSKEKLEYDHIIPVAKGGSNTERNIQLLCEKCNRKKAAGI